MAVRTPDDSRTLAVISDAGEAEVTVREDIAGAKVAVHPDGTANLMNERCAGRRASPRRPVLATDRFESRVSQR